MSESNTYTENKKGLKEILRGIMQHIIPIDFASSKYDVEYPADESILPDTLIESTKSISNLENRELGESIDFSIEQTPSTRHSSKSTIEKVQPEHTSKGRHTSVPKKNVTSHDDLTL